MASKASERKFLRILDANFNRAKEGLRVCEDICRFLYDERTITRQYKDVRHALSQIMARLKVQELIASRDAQKDVGRPSSESEFKRRTVKDIFFANSQRVKESVRVLEEFAKLCDSRVAEDLKGLRYRIYRLEQAMAERL